MNYEIALHVQFHMNYLLRRYELLAVQANMNYSAYAEYGDPSAALTAYRWLRMTFYKEKHVTQNAPERMNSGAFGMD